MEGQLNKVAIIDYGMCNLDSVTRAIEECGGQPVVTDQVSEIESAVRIILPGVGAFPDAMKNLRERFLDQVLCEQVLGKKIPFLGICLGMQLLATVGLEGGNTLGLGWIQAEVRRLEATSPETRIPHIGWNEVHLIADSPLFGGIPSGRDFYFVHSYHLIPSGENDVVGRTPYCGQFVSAINRDNVFGVQFHPEKSQRVGFQIIRNFLNL